MMGSLGGGRTRSDSTSRYDSSAARAEEAQLTQTKKITVSTGKSVDRLGYVSNRASESLIDFNRKTGLAGAGLGELSAVVGKSIAQISAQRADLGKIDMSTTLETLQKAVENAAGSIQSQALAKGDTTGFAKTVGTLDSILDGKVNPSLGIFASSLGLASKTLIDLWGDMREQRRDGGKEIAEFGKGVQVAANALSRNRGVGEYFEKFILQLRRANVALRELRGGVRGSGGSGFGGGGGGSGNALDMPGDRPAPKGDQTPGFSIVGMVKTMLNPVTAAFGIASKYIVTNAIKVVDQGLQVTGARGLGFLGSTFQTLSINAMAAGMKLEDYTKMLDENEGTVSRFASFNDFDKQLDVGRDQLKKFGIFGQEATNLTASMVNSAQSLGVPVDDLSKSISGQMSVFETLRKTTGLTAEQFQELNRSLQQNETVQREMIGLDPAQRAARGAELLQISSMGRSLGLTAQESSKLSDALLAQRKSTVRDRFQARGRTQQALSLVGMDPETVAEAATLAGKRMKTPEENKRLLDIMGDYNARAEEIKQNGGDGMANAVEESQAKLDETIMKPLSDSSIAIKAAQQSGDQINKEMNQKLSSTVQSLGTIATWIEGMAQSPIMKIGMGLVSGAISLFAMRTDFQLASILNAIRVGGIGGSKSGSNAYGSPDDFIGPNRPGEGPASGKGKWAGRLSKFGKVAGIGLGMVGAAAGLYSGYQAYQGADATANGPGGDGDVGKARGEAIGEGLGSATGGIIASLAVGLAPLTGGLSLVAGAIAGLVLAFGGGAIGKWIGGLIGSESASEKNSKQVDKLTKQIIETRRAGAGSNIIATDNIAALGANVAQTGTAYSAPMGVTAIATPTSMTPTSVNQDAVNTAASTAATAAVSTTNTATTAAAALPNSDQGSTLADILKTLQQSLTVENTHVELIGQLVRSQAFATRLPDNVLMNNQARLTA